MLLFVGCVQLLETTNLQAVVLFWLVGWIFLVGEIDTWCSPIFLSQMLHVWNIYLHLPKNHPNVGKYTIHGASGFVNSLFIGWNTTVSVKKSTPSDSTQIHIVSARKGDPTGRANLGLWREDKPGIAWFLGGCKSIAKAIWIYVCIYMVVTYIHIYIYIYIYIIIYIWCTIRILWLFWSIVWK